MTSSTLKALGIFMLALSASIFANAQTQPQKKTCSISGKITVKGAGVAGIQVGAINQRSGRSRFAAITDSQGNYRISDLAPGTYDLSPAAPQFVIGIFTGRKSVMIDEGESVEGVDFSLIRGGVISGKVTNADGQPVIEEEIHLTAVQQGSDREPVQSLNMHVHQTDDRGMYRVFGLAPGKYTVSAGAPPSRLSFRRRGGVNYRQTYYPSATDAAQATVIEVTEGSEKTNVDIVVSRQASLYKASGRVINGETGRPIPNARYGITKIEEYGSSGTSGPVTNALGEFSFEDLTPGKYMVTLDPANGEFYADGVRFDIEDHDVTDLVVKTTTGASVSGVVVFDGLDQKTARQRFGELAIIASGMGTDRYVNRRNGPPAKVGADGSFTLNGLSAGEAQFTIFAQRGSEDGRNFEVVRVEREGVALQRNLEIKEREQMSGVRVVINARTGILQGVVKVENGQLVPAMVYVSINKVGENNGYGASLDTRGRFRLGGLSPGTYEVSAGAMGPINVPVTKQQVVINDDQVTQVTLTLDLKPTFNPDRP